MAQITKERIGQYLQAAFKAIDSAGGSLRSKDVLSAIEQELHLNDYEKAALEKTGNTRWQSVVYFYSIDCVKAGWLRKNSGVWYLTEEGRAAMSYAPSVFIETASSKYKEWKKQQKPVIEQAEITDAYVVTRETVYERAVADSRVQIVNFINEMGPYDFQDLCAALLRGMGYYTPFVAPPGKDGGIDIVAYRDPIGVSHPRLKVQVKHRDQKVERKEVSELMGALHDGDMGLIISSGGFSKDAEKEIRHSAKHIGKMDLDDLISFWDKQYGQLSEDDKAMLPLRRISFLAPED